MRDKGPGRHSGHRYSARRLRQRRAVKITAAGAIALVVGVGLAVAIRPVIGGATLEASASPSGPLFGAPASSAGQLAENSGKFGTLGIIRTPSFGLQAAKAWSTAPLGTTKSAVIVSFAATPAAVLAGTDDTPAQFFDAAPAGHRVYYAYYSEPETHVSRHLFTVSQYRRAWMHIAALARKAGQPRADTDPDPERIRPQRPLGRELAELLAWPPRRQDHRLGRLSDRHADGSRPAAHAAGDLHGAGSSSREDRRLQFGFAGFALATAKGRPAWLKTVGDYLMSSGALFGVLTSPAKPPRLSSPTPRQSRPGTQW